MEAQRVKKDEGQVQFSLLLIWIENYAVTLENNLVVSNM